MKTKLIAASLCFSLMASMSNAQTAPGATMQAGGVTFGVRAGVNFQNLNGKDAADNKTEYKIKPGFNAGVNAEIPVATDFYVQPGVLFTTKGAKLKNDDKINLSYIEVPVNLIYKPLLGMNRVLLGFGPYVGFAVGGKYKADNGNSTDITFKNSISATEAVSGYYARRFDAGANFLAGYELSSNLSLQLNAQLGLVKVNPENSSVASDKTSVKNTGFGISAGYRF